MSSPVPPSSVNNSQGADMQDENDTPTTTPPEAVSGTTTPAPEVPMTEPNENSGNDQDHEPEKMEEDPQGEADDEDDSANDLLTLPLSKIKKIFKIDPNYQGASNTAVYATGLATELFVRYLTEHASMLAKMEKRKKVVYKDFANAVAGHESLNFLSQTIPKTQPLRDLVQQKKINIDKEDEAKATEIVNGSEISPETHTPQVNKPVLPKGQQVLNFASANNVNKAVIHDLVINNGSESNEVNTTELHENDRIIAD